MNKIEKIQKIYAIVVGLFVVAVGIAFICVTANIYYSGKDTGVIFTSEIVTARLQELAIPFCILLGVIVVGVVFPIYDTHVKNSSEDIVRLLEAKIPSEGTGDEYNTAANKYKKLCNIRLGLWIAEGVILLGCVIATLCYMLNTANFLGQDITAEIFNMFKNVFPYIAVAFVTLIAAAVINGFIAKKRLAEIRTLIKYGNGVNAEPTQNKLQKLLVGTEKVLTNNITLWVIRGILFAVGVTFVVLGVLNGGANDVLVKAINICTECIGLG